MGLAAALFVVGIFFGIRWTLDSIYLWQNYELVEVRVEKVEELCKLVDRMTLNGHVSRDYSPCPDNLTPYFNKERVPFTTIEAGLYATFQYRSPVDDKMRTGQVLTKRTMAEQPVSVGDKIWVHVSLHYPSDVIR